MELQNVIESDHNFDKSDVDDDDDIYEKIEAPKYVDLTRPDQFLPDDRFWFCSRIGCDQNHEDIDPDALHKSFMLRVMAARSPNVRLRKTLRCREVPSAYMKCPRSAPAKPSKPRVCRFAAVTSVTQKIVNAKMKASPVVKFNLTPKAKPKGSSSAAKALTAPRGEKKCISSSARSQSVQNPKTANAAPKSRVVSKALVFDTPKKSDRNNSLLLSETPLTEICDGMKKLVLNSQRNKSSRFSSKSAKGGAASNSKMTRNASDPLTSKLYAQHLNMNSPLKSFEDCTHQGLKYTKSASTKRLRKPSCPRPHSMANSDMEIDKDMRNESIGLCTVVSNEGNEIKEQCSVLRITGITQEQCLPSTGDSLQTAVDDSNYSSARSKSNHEKVSSEEGIEVNNVDEHRRALDSKVLELRDDSAGNARAKSLAFNTPKESETGKSVLASETPLTEICNGLKKLLINSQRKKPSANPSKSSRCTASRPKKTRTASDPSTSEQYSEKLKTRVKDSEDSKGNKSTRVRKRTSCKGKTSIANTDTENDKETRNVSILGTSGNSDRNENEEQSELLITTQVVTLTTQEECVRSLDISSSPMVENVQTALEDFSICPNAISLSDSAKVSEGCSLCPQILDGVESIVLQEHCEGGTEVPPEQPTCSIGVSIASEENLSSVETCLTGENVQTFDVLSKNQESDLPNPEKELKMDEHIGHQNVSEVASKHRRNPEDVLVCQASNTVALESEFTQSDDKENVATSNQNSDRDSNHCNKQSQRNILQTEDAENQQKGMNLQGKALKGTSVVASTSYLSGKYKKTKPTNPKPFRLRTDERGILREANLEKRHHSAPLREIPVSHNSDGCIQRRHANEQKVKSHGQHRQENISHEGNQIKSEKQIVKSQPEQARVAYHKTTKCVVDPKIATSSTQAHKKVDSIIEKETQNREQRTTKSQLLQQRIIKTQSRGTGSRKATVPSRRLSIIMETSSTVLRSKDAKSRNKGIFTTTVSSSGKSSTRVKKPVTVPKEPNFHRVHTPKRCIKNVTEVIHTPKSCAKPLTEVTAS